MAKITTSIPVQKFEIVRDRIAAILIEELTNQAVLQPDGYLKNLLNSIKVYSERFHPFSESEMIAISVFFFNNDFDSKQQQSIRGKNTFFIDLFGFSPSTNREEGDKINAVNLQRIIGMIRFIFESPHYIRLGFDDPPLFINKTIVQSIKRTEEENARDSGNIIMYRVVFEVDLTEEQDQVPSVALNSSYTNVTIEETDLGFEYIIDPDLPT